MKFRPSSLLKLLPTATKAPDVPTPWKGTVTALGDPLTVMLDGNLYATPVGTSLQAPEQLAVGDRVWGVHSGRQAVLVGRIGGGDTSTQFKAAGTAPPTVSWNDVDSPGIYPQLMQGVSNPNGPGSEFSTGVNGRFYVHVFAYSGGDVTQIAYPYSGSWMRFHYRTRISGVWSAWRALQTADHTHDDRYYTEAEVTSLLAGKAATSHTHDDRYFTESEVTTALAGKAATSHTHDDRYYTESEVTSLLAGKAATSHTHDDRYYTEAEVNALLATKLGNDPTRFRAVRASTATLAAGYTRITGYDAVQYNVGSGFNSTTGFFVVPETGLYFLSAHVGFATATSRKIAVIEKGTATAGTNTYLVRSEAAATGYASLNVSADIPLTAGESVALCAYSSAESNLAITPEIFFSARKVV